MKRIIDIVGESWKPVVGFPGYEVSNKGRIKGNRNRKEFKLLRLKECKIYGYVYIMLIDENSKRYRKTVHTLVGRAFLPPPAIIKPTINHINLDKRNNYVDNLEWKSLKDNVQHAFENGASCYQGFHFVDGVEMKLCRGCNKEKPRTAYQRLSKKLGTMMSKCSKCRRYLNHRNYMKHHEERKATRRLK